MNKYISKEDHQFAEYCKQILRRNPGDVWVDPIVPQRLRAIPMAFTAWQYSYLKIDDYIERAVEVAKKNNKKVRLYIQDTADVWYHDDIKNLFNPSLSRNYTNSPPGEVHGHSHMVGGQFVGGNTENKIGLIKRFVQEGLVEIALQKVLGDTGSGSFSQILKAHQDVVNDEFNGAKFVNMSYGGPSSYSPLSLLMKEGKEKHNIFHFASIGNAGYRQGEDKSGFPGNDKSTIGCASIDAAGKRSYFSSVDFSRIAMFMAAPGSSVTTTLKDNTYGNVNGTSFSCPNSCAMGIIQYLLNPAITNQHELESAFIEDLVDFGEKGRDKFLGYGVPIMSNTYFTIENPPPPPDPDPIPSIPSLIFPINNVILTDSSVGLRWNVSEYATSYKLQLYTKANELVSERTMAGTSRSFTLANNNYKWRVKAMNGTGESEYSKFQEFVIKVESTLNPPQLSSPIDRQVIKDTEIEFKWSKVAKATSYYIEVEKDNKIVVDEIVYINSYFYEDIEPGVYTWKVKSIDEDNNLSEFSKTFTFTIEEDNEVVWPEKTTIFSIDTEFQTKYKLPSSSDLIPITFKVNVKHNYKNKTETLYDLVRDRLDSFYKRSFISFTKETVDHPVALYYIARFTKILLKDIEVEMIVSSGEVATLLEKEDLQRFPKMDIEATIEYLW